MAYYIFLFAASVIISVLYFFRNQRYSYKTVAFMYVLAMISNLGYYLLARAQELREAMLANIIIYIGGAFLNLLALIAIIQMCKVNFPKIILSIAAVLSGFIFLSVLTNDYHHLYFKSVQLEHIGNVSYITKEYGPLHLFFYIMLAIYILLDIAVITYTLKEKKNASIKNTILLLVVVFISIGAYLFGRVAGIRYELCAVSNVAFQLIFLIIDMRGFLYNYDELLSNALVKRKELGYIGFDSSFHFLGADDTLKEWFPQVYTLRVDMKPELGSDFMEKLIEISQMVDSNNHYELIFAHGNNYYKLRANHLIVNKKKKGYSFYIEDATAEQLQMLKVTYEKEHDAMTNLYNKGKYMELVEDHYQNLDSIAILNMDVNNLKKMNDTYGHEAGDNLIIKAAKSVLAIQSEKVKAFRLGGDEFMVIGENLSKEDFEQLLVDWKNAVSMLNQQPDGIEIVIACGAVYGEKGYSLNDLFKAADEKMYEDKKRLKS